MRDDTSSPMFLHLGGSLLLTPATLGVVSMTGRDGGGFAMAVGVRPVGIDDRIANRCYPPTRHQSPIAHSLRSGVSSSCLAFIAVAVHRRHVIRQAWNDAPGRDFACWVGHVGGRRQFRFRSLIRNMDEAWCQNGRQPRVCGAIFLWWLRAAWWCRTISGCRRSDFEGLLPYAVALGVEKKWSQVFEGLDWHDSSRRGCGTGGGILLSAEAWCSGHERYHHHHHGGLGWERNVA